MTAHAIGCHSYSESTSRLFLIVHHLGRLDQEWVGKMGAEIAGVGNCVAAVDSGRATRDNSRCDARPSR